MKLLKLPSIIKITHPATHVFVKGYRGKQLFCEPADYLVYLALLKQYVRLQQSLDADEPFKQAVQLHAYSLQAHTIQLLVRDRSQGAEIQKLMRALHISYTRYYHKKYTRKGIIFSDVYKSTIVDDNRDEVALVQAMHAVKGNKWYQDSHFFYEPGRHAQWLTPLKL